MGDCGMLEVSKIRFSTGTDGTSVISGIEVRGADATTRIPESKIEESSCLPSGAGSTPEKDRGGISQDVSTISPDKTTGTPSAGRESSSLCTIHPSNQMNEDSTLLATASMGSARLAVFVVVVIVVSLLVNLLRVSVIEDEAKHGYVYIGQ